MSLPILPHNAQLLELRTPADLAAQLAAVGESERPTLPEWERFRQEALRLERVTAGLRSRIQALAAARASGLRLYGSGPALVLTGSRAAFRDLAGGLRAGGEAEAAAAIERCLSGGPGEWRWGRRALDFRRGPFVMGVLNCTPDSFYPGSRLSGPEAALEAARSMIAAGAHILDVGGESTRPGSDAVPAGEEIRRVVPVLEAIRRESEVLLSVDTRKPEVAEAALAAGADILNDVSALRAEREAAGGTSVAQAGAQGPAQGPGGKGEGGQGGRRLAALAAGHGVPLVLMHMRGEPKTMQVEPHYRDVVSEVLEELAAAVQFAAAAGVEKLIVDPGIGFGKRLQDNLRLLKNLGALRALGCPVLIGLSRKSFLGAVTGAPVEGRLPATIAAHTLALLAGADIVRAHDVPEAVQTVRLLQAVLGTSGR
jgi:dihydropteroate synthase